MSEPSTIGIIGGTGWLGRSLALALLETGFVLPEALLLSNRSGTLDDPQGSLAGVGITADNQELVARSELVILSVRPQGLSSMALDVQGKLLVSLVAGASLADLQAHCASQRVIRAMPNAALDIRQSYTPWLASAQVEAPAKAYVQRLFETCGAADEVFSEAQLNYLTALSGTGPSYPALLARALFRDALARGLPEGVARRAVIGVVVQASQLIGERHGFEALLQRLSEYRGVSAAAIEAMAEAGFEASVGAGLDRAMEVAQSRLFEPVVAPQKPR